MGNSERALPSRAARGKKHLWIPVTTVLLGVAAAALGAYAAPPSTTHGAMTMEEQQRRLDELLKSSTAAPKGVDPVAWAGIYVPTDNELTADRIALGRRLYFDTKLSKDGTVACATCHDISRGFTDNRNVSEGIGDHLGQRSAPTAMNAALLQNMFWDGRAPTLEEQAKLPILNPIEMGHPDAASAMAAVGTDPAYQGLFQKAYGRAPNYDDLGRAIASFERTLIFLDAPFDRFAAGDAQAISPAAQRGLALFNGKARCVSCHMINSSNPVGTDNLFHNIGVSARKQNFEVLAQRGLSALRQAGRSEGSGQAGPGDRSIRVGPFPGEQGSAATSAPSRPNSCAMWALRRPTCMTGSLRNLWDVMDHYNKGGETNAYLDGRHRAPEFERDRDQRCGGLPVHAHGYAASPAQNEAAQKRQQAQAAQKRPFRDDALAHREVLPFEQRVLGAAGLK